jgi:hypothetical protein
MSAKSAAGLIRSPSGMPLPRLSSFVYLVLLSWAIFFGGSNVAPVAEVMLPSFTSLTGVVVAFYFGSIAVTEVAKTHQPNTPTPTGQESHPADKPDGR